MDDLIGGERSHIANGCRFSHLTLASFVTDNRFRPTFGPIPNVRQFGIELQPKLTIVVFLLLLTIGSAHLAEATPSEQFEHASKVPTDLSEKATLNFVELQVIFDGALLRRGDGGELVIFFLHLGYWTKQEIEHETQPIVVQLNRAREKDVKLVVPDSPFERRLIELLNDDLTNKEHSRERIKTLTRIRDCVRGRKPLDEVKKWIPAESEE